MRLIREAKSRGLAVTAEVTPHHLTLTDENVLGYDTHCKVNPPLRSEEDRPRGPLRMGAVPTAMPVLARFAAMLQARHPGIVPVVLSLSSQELEAGLEGISKALRG